MNKKNPVKTRHLWFVLMFLSMEGLCAETRTQRLETFPNNAMDGVQIDLEIRRPNEAKSKKQEGGSLSFKVGERVLICFKVNQDGYVTLWDQTITDIGLEKKPLVPNEFQSQAEPVKAGQEHCIGDAKYGIRVDKAVKDAKLFIHWTRTLDDAVPLNAYPAPISEEGAKSPVKRRSIETSYASRTITYSAE